MKRLIIKHQEKLTPETARKQFEELYLGMDRPLVIMPPQYDIVFEPSEWIRLDVVMPPKYKDLILCDKNGIEYIAIYDDLERFIDRSGEKVEDIIAWMPAPQAYSEDE